MRDTISCLCCTRYSRCNAECRERDVCAWCVCVSMHARKGHTTNDSVNGGEHGARMHAFFSLSIRFEKEKPWHNGALFFRNTDARSFPVRFQLCAFSLFYFATFALVSFVIPRLWTVGTEIHRTDICIYRHTHIYECNEAQPRFAFTNDFSMNFSFYFCILFVVCFSPFFGYRSFAIELLFQNCLKFRI